MHNNVINATQAVAAGASPAIFNNPEFGSVRIIVKENSEPLFCLKDVALCLGYSDPSSAVSKRCDSSCVSILAMQHETGSKQTSFGPESEVYRLIFGSKLDSAKKFQDWVFKEVLPSIRKTGSYSIQKTPQTYIEALKETLRLAEENEKLTLENKEQALKIEEDAPKVECWDQFIASKNNVHIRTFVKMIQDRFPKVREAWIFKSLREAGILQSQGFFKNIPYAEYGPTGKGYFALKQSAFGATPLLTPKGQEWCYNMIKDYYEAIGNIEDMFEEEF